MAAHLGAKDLKLSRRGRIVPHETTGGPHRAEGKVRAGDDRAGPHAAELQARPSEVRDDPILEAQALEGGGP